MPVLLYFTCGCQAIYRKPDQMISRFAENVQRATPKSRKKTHLKSIFKPINE